MIPEQPAISVCEEFLPNQCPSFEVIASDDGYLPTIETVVRMDQLSALSMRMYDLGWLLQDVHGIISKIDKRTKLQTDPLVFVEYMHPSSFNIHDKVPKYFPVN